MGHHLTLVVCFTNYEKWAQISKRPFTIRLAYNFDLELSIILGPLHIWAKGCDHVTRRALDSHPKTMPFDMVCRDLHQAYLLEMGMMQIPTDHETSSIVDLIRMPSVLCVKWSSRVVAELKMSI